MLPVGLLAGERLGFFPHRTRSAIFPRNHVIRPPAFLRVVSPVRRCPAAIARRARMAIPLVKVTWLLAISLEPERVDWQRTAVAWVILAGC